MTEYVTILLAKDVVFLLAVCVGILWIPLVMFLLVALLDVRNSILVEMSIMILVFSLCTIGIGGFGYCMYFLLSGGLQ